MPIREYLDDRSVFSPETVAIMNRAFRTATLRLGFDAGHADRERLATIIIHLARAEPSLSAATLAEQAISTLHVGGLVPGEGIEQIGEGA
ncbi:MAG: hypothetical protein E7774_08010 [Bradyrhizobium sp.]|nr:MAG: hypothetical protein E7774_08010 [Bradyrhizobium sp.]